MKKNNVEFVSDMMNYGPNAIVAQMFIMEAIRRYAETVANCQPRELAGMSGGIISPEAWIATGKEINAKMKERLG